MTTAHRLNTVDERIVVEQFGGADKINAAYSAAPSRWTRSARQ